MAALGLADQYLSLLKKSLLNQTYPELEAQVHILLMDKLAPSIKSLPELIERFSTIQDHAVFHQLLKAKAVGGVVPYYAATADGTETEYLPMRNLTFMSHTMIGQARLDNLQDCLDRIVADKVPGDLVETGVWRGGATVFMRGYLMAHGIRNRRVWVADSFAGLPKPSLDHDAGCDLSAEPFPYLAVSEDKVRALFERYDLLDDKVRFLQGWFKDTLPRAPIRRLALLRLDGDLYESTMDALNALYDKVSIGGYVIVDDYKALKQCEQAITDFRLTRGIEDSMVQVDGACVYWQKTKA